MILVLLDIDGGLCDQPILNPPRWRYPESSADAVGGDKQSDKQQGRSIRVSLKVSRLNKADVRASR